GATCTQSPERQRAEHRTTGTFGATSRALEIARPTPVTMIGTVLDDGHMSPNSCRASSQGETRDDGLDHPPTNPARPESIERPVPRKTLAAILGVQNRLPGFVDRHLSQVGRIRRAPELTGIRSGVIQADRREQYHSLPAASQIALTDVSDALPHEVEPDCLV